MANTPATPAAPYTTAATPMLFANTDAPTNTDAPAPIRPRAPWATKTRALSLGLFGLTTVLGLVAGKRLFRPKHLTTTLTNTAKQITAPQTKAEQSFTTYRNIDSPLLTLAFLSQRKELRGVLGWFGLSSAVGYIGGQALAGLQEAWVRAEETAIRMRGMDAMATTYQHSVHQRNQTLATLKQRTWHTIRTWLTEAGIAQPDNFNPYTGHLNSTPPADKHDTWQRRLHTNYLLEPRQRPLANFSGHMASNAPADSGFFAPTNPAQARLSAVSPSQWLPALSGVAGAATGLTLAGVKNTASQMQGLVQRATMGVTKHEAVTGLFVKNTEALAVLAKQLEAPLLLLTYGLAVGLITAGKLGIDALREIAVTEENTRTELTYQRYLWQDLGTRLMKGAEVAWLQVQLAQLAKDLPALTLQPHLLKQRIGSIVQGIGLNSAPPHYNTPLNLNITAARS